MKTECPVCHATEKLAVFEITYSQGMHTVLWRCSVCDYHYVFPAPSQEFLAAFYADEYCSHVAALDDWRQKAMKERVRRIEKYQSPPARLLDVGCGNGYFCLVAQEHGWEVCGIEPTESAVERADPAIRSRLKVGTLADLELPEASFDMVTLWAVLEHLLDPAGEIERAVHLLVTGGTLFLQLPNIQSFAARAYGANWRLIKNSPDHVGFPTLKTMEYFCEQFGLVLLETKYHGLPFPLGSASAQNSVPDSRSKDSSDGQILSKVLNRPGLSRAARSTISLLRLGDDVEYVLRKL